MNLNYKNDINYIKVLKICKKKKIKYCQFKFLIYGFCGTGKI